MNQKEKFILLTRNEFKDWLSNTSFRRIIKIIQNHHTWKPSYAQFDGKNYFAQLEGMERSHNERGLGGIAQNITTFIDGLIAICRSFEEMPAGIKNANGGAICIEHLGNFDENGDIMTDEHRETIIFVNALLCLKFNIIPNTDFIVYHHWYDLNTGKRTDGTGSTKSCPGTNFFGGNTVEAARNNFIPLIQNLYNLTKNKSFVDAKNDNPQQKGKILVNDLRIRTGPGLTHNVVAKLKIGTIIDICEERDGWYKIGENQWVFAKYVQLIEK